MSYTMFLLQLTPAPIGISLSGLVPIYRNKMAMFSLMMLI